MSSKYSCRHREEIRARRVRQKNCSKNCSWNFGILFFPEVRGREHFVAGENGDEEIDILNMRNATRFRMLDIRQLQRSCNDNFVKDRTCITVLKAPLSIWKLGYSIDASIQFQCCP